MNKNETNVLKDKKKSCLCCVCKAIEKLNINANKIQKHIKLFEKIIPPLKRLK